MLRKVVAMPNTERKLKSCLGCVYYYVTWDKNASKGCKFFGFKSDKMPCIVVFESSNNDCTQYTHK